MTLNSEVGRGVVAPNFSWLAAHGVSIQKDFAISVALLVAISQLEGGIVYPELCVKWVKTLLYILK